MREHPIPQDITGYRFHIVGSMTLKQFGEIGLGVVVAIIIYNTNLFGVVKWPLILLSFGIGALAAFVPIAERPLDHWIITFFKVLYKPTQFFWKKEPRIPDVFTFTANLNTQSTDPELDLTPARRERIKEFLTTLRTPLSVQAGDLDVSELQKLESVAALFGEQTTPAPTLTTPPTPPTPAPTKPHLEIRVRNLSSGHNPKPNTTPAPTATQERVAAQKVGLKTDVVAQAVAVPKLETIKTDSAKVLKEAGELDLQGLTNEDRAFSQVKSQEQHNPNNTAVAQVNAELPFPTKPTEPNKLVGMVLTQNNELITDAIVEIQDLSGKIVRAVKTNALGQFFITTPLRKGEYVVVTEKDSFTFAPLKISLKDTVVAPLEIRGQEVA